MLQPQIKNSKDIANGIEIISEGLPFSMTPNAPSIDFKVGYPVFKKVNPAGDVGKLNVRWEEPYKVIRKSARELYI